MSRDAHLMAPEFWQGELGAALYGEPVRAHVASYLAFGPHQNACGMFWLPVPALSGLLGLEPDVVREAVQALEEAGFLRYDDRLKWFWIVGHLAKQWPKGLKETDNNLVWLQKEVAEARKCTFYGDFIELYAAEFNLDATPSEGVPKGSTPAPDDPLPRVPARGSGSGSGSGSDLDQDLEGESARERAAPTPTARAEHEIDPEAVERGFEQVARGYIRGKVDRFEAQREFIRLREVGDGTPAPQIVATVRAYRESGEWSGPKSPVQFAPKLSKYLRDRMHWYAPEGRSPPPRPDEPAPPDPYAGLTGAERLAAKARDSREESPESVARLRDSAAFERWQERHQPSPELVS